MRAKGKNEFKGSVYDFTLHKYDYKNKTKQKIQKKTKKTTVQ